MKHFVYIVLFSLHASFVLAQIDSSLREKPESSNNHTTKSVISKTNNNAAAILHDTLGKNIGTADSLVAIKDSTFFKDSIAKIIQIKDSLQRDSLNKAAALHASIKDTTTYAAIIATMGLPFYKPPIFMLMQEKHFTSKDDLFYEIVSIIFFMALVRLLFPKYFQNIFRLSFQASFRQKHTREQLSQEALASLFMNLLFIITGGMYWALVAMQLNVIEIAYWKMMLYASLLLGIIYTGKYLFLSLLGWMFNVKDAAGTYTFIVFLINKIAAVMLMPFLLLIAFAAPTISSVSITISFILLIILLLYRYIVSLGTIRSSLKVSALHFFLYLCTVEIMPLLILYKLLINYIGYFL